MTTPSEAFNDLAVYRYRGRAWNRPGTTGQLFELLQELSDNDGLVEISNRDAAALTKRGLSTMQRAFVQLLKAGDITVVHNGTGCGYPTVYRVLKRDAEPVD